MGIIHLTVFAYLHSLPAFFSPSRPNNEKKTTTTTRHHSDALLSLSPPLPDFPLPLTTPLSVLSPTSWAKPGWKIPSSKKKPVHFLSARTLSLPPHSIPPPPPPPFPSPPVTSSPLPTFPPLPPSLSLSLLLSTNPFPYVSFPPLSHAPSPPTLLTPTTTPPHQSSSSFLSLTPTQQQKIIISHKPQKKQHKTTQQGKVSAVFFLCKKRDVVHAAMFRLPSSVTRPPWTPHPKKYHPRITRKTALFPLPSPPPPDIIPSLTCFEGELPLGPSTDSCTKRGGDFPPPPSLPFPHHPSHPPPLENMKKTNPKERTEQKKTTYEQNKRTKTTATTTTTTPAGRVRSNFLLEPRTSKTYP